MATIDGPAHGTEKADGTSNSSAFSLIQQVPCYGRERNITEDDIYNRFFDWVEERGIDPWPHQEEAMMDLVSGDHVILATPTGSGKSMVAQGFLFAALCTGRKAYYTAPIKALVSEKFFDAVAVFGKENVGMITGDTHINVGAAIICCTAEILAQETLRGNAGDDVCVAMDEFHYYGDPQRGWAWQVPLLTLPHAQFLMMSATLGDTSSIRATLDRCTDRDTDLVADAQRPIPLSYRYIDSTPVPQTLGDLMKAGDAPVYVVHFAQEAAIRTAEDLSSFGVATREQRAAIKEAITGFKFTTSFGKTLRRLLVTGVGVHHAGMLPRYRRLVEQLAQQGLLPVICGTDTLGVGINVPIHTVLFTALTKYDGFKQRRLRAREFHQIAGRAGRSGFDSEGLCLAQAPEYEIENAQAEAKAKASAKKKRVVKKKPKEGFVGWNAQTFDKLIAAAPETLVPHLQITHSMVLSEIAQGGDARERLSRLIADSAQTDKQKAELEKRTDEIFGTLEGTGVVERRDNADGTVDYSTTLDVPDNFALDEPLSPFLLAALELLDPESPTYALDVVSMMESTLEDPWAVLKAQQRQARNAALQEMKEEGLEYDERVEKLQDVTYPKPLEELLTTAFDHYRRDVPWANDYKLSPKSVLRDMLETASDFNGYIARYGIERSEGGLLRYLSDAYKALNRTVPREKFDDRLYDILSWLRLVVTGVDSSLLDEWQQAEDSGGNVAAEAAAIAPPSVDDVVEDRRGLTLLVRNALFRRVELVATEREDVLGELDSPWGMSARAWSDVLDSIYDEHDEILTGQQARSRDFFLLDASHEHDEHTWHVRQILDDMEGDHDWAIDGIIDLDATQDSGEAVFFDYQVSPLDELSVMSGRN